MYKFTVKPMEKNEDYYSIEHPSITVEMTNSNKTLEIVKGILPEIEPIKRIIHNRGAKAVYYPTYIEGSVHTVLITHAFTSGYGGSGPKCFGGLLQHLGVSDQDIERFIYTEGPDRAVISIDFQ